MLLGARNFYNIYMTQKIRFFRRGPKPPPELTKDKSKRPIYNFVSNPPPHRQIGV